MATHKELLTQEEIDALLSGVDSGNVTAEGERAASESLRGRLPPLELVNEKFARFFRSSLFDLMRHAATIAAPAAIVAAATASTAPPHQRGVAPPLEPARPVAARYTGALVSAGFDASAIARTLVPADPPLRDRVDLLARLASRLPVAPRAVDSADARIRFVGPPGALGFGEPLSACWAAHLPIVWVGTGNVLPDGIEPATGELLATLALADVGLEADAKEPGTADHEPTRAAEAGARAPRRTIAVV